MSIKDGDEVYVQQGEPRYAHFRKAERMPAETSIKDWQVMPACCKTCPFGENGDERTRQNVIERIAGMQASQICHHPALSSKKETHLCRGARDIQLKLLYSTGMIEEPTDAAFKKRSDEVLGKEEA